MGNRIGQDRIGRCSVEEHEYIIVEWGCLTWVMSTTQPQNKDAQKAY